MAAGDRNKKGRATDIVRHYGFIGAGKTICGRNEAGYTTDDKSDVTCKNCLKRLTNA